MADDDNNDDNESEQDRFNRWYEERRNAEKAEAERTKKLKDLGLTDDVLGAIGDSVFARFQRAAEEAAKAKEDADQAPSRGDDGEPSKVQQFLFGKPKAS